MRMPTPQIASHRASRDEMAQQDRLPGERMEHGLREHHSSPHETFGREDKAEQHPKAEIGIVLGQYQEHRGKGPKELEYQPVESGEGAHNPERDLDMCRWHKPADTFEKGCTEHMGCRERVAGPHVEAQEPEGNGRSPAGAGNNSFLGPFGCFRPLYL